MNARNAGKRIAFTLLTLAVGFSLGRVEKPKRPSAPVQLTPDEVSVSSPEGCTWFKVAHIGHENEAQTPSKRQVVLWFRGDDKVKFTSYIGD